MLARPFIFYQIFGHDCSDVPLITLQKGRWGVYHNKLNGDMLLRFGGVE